MRIHSRLPPFVIALQLALAPATTLHAQQAQQPEQKQEQKPPPQAPAGEVVRITTQLVQIDAVVTDKRGEHVDDLTEDDFELTVDGKRQTLTFFKLVKLPEPATAPAKAEKGEKSPKPAPALTSMPAKALAPEDVRRTIAFVVDDLGLSFESINYARRAIKKFVDEQMQEGDLVAVIRTGRGAGIFQQFTGDKRILSAAVEKLSWNPFSRDMIPRFSQPGAGLPGDTSQEARQIQFAAKNIF